MGLVSESVTKSSLQYSRKARVQTNHGSTSIPSWTTNRPAGIWCNIKTIPAAQRAAEIAHMQPKTLLKASVEICQSLLALNTYFLHESIEYYCKSFLTTRIVFCARHSIMIWTWKRAGETDDRVTVAMKNVTVRAHRREQCSELDTMSNTRVLCHWLSRSVRQMSAVRALSMYRPACMLKVQEAAEKQHRRPLIVSFSSSYTSLLSTRIVDVSSREKLCNILQYFAIFCKVKERLSEDRYEGLWN